MSELKYFLKENKKERETTEYAATKTLCDEKGEPVKWTIKAISTAENNAIRDDCMYEIPVKGKPNMFRAKLNTSKYIALMLSKSVVFPNLNDTQLQDSYGVCSPEDLVKAMVDIPAEYDAFAQFVQQFNGFDVSLSDKVEEAKN